MKTKAPSVIADRKIKIALVGCGRIAKNHLEAIQQHQENLTLTAVCDTDLEALKNACNTYQVEGYENLETLLAASDADLVVLCTPSGLHAEQTIQIAKAERHVLTEKPMATRWQDGRDMVKACKDAKVRLFVVKQNRLNPPLQALKKAVTEGRFGKIYLASARVFWTRPQSYYDAAKWRGTWELDGGAYMNQASHYIDLMHWLLGPVESVQAMMGTLARQIEAEDTGVVNMRWRHGALGSVAVTMLTYPKNLEGSITILGEKGSARVGGIAVNSIEHWEFDQKRPEDESIQQANYQTASVYGSGHLTYYQNVIRCLQGKETALVDGTEGLASLQLLIAAYRAARDNKTIHLPLEL
jgi:UDP-N-acetyl-2-amino-2-deoxyglucuronate dehydrogenase